MIVTRYLAREVLQTVLVVTFVLFLVFICQQSVRYLNYVAIGKVPTDVLFKLIGFEAPFLLTLLLPLGLYLGVMLAYGRSYADNEMAILQMGGFGYRPLLRLTFLISLAITGIILFLMLWVNPLVSAKRQQILSSDEVTLHLIQTLRPGRFQVSPDGKHVMYAERISRDHTRAKNIFLAQQRKSKLQNSLNSDSHDDQDDWMVVVANEGYQTKDTESHDQLFVTTDGYRYEGTPGFNDYKIIQFKAYKIRMPNNVHAFQEENEALSSWQLWHDYHDPHRAAELQWRFSIGISAFLLALLAVPLSAVQPRKGRYLIFLPAIVIYIVYINLLLVARRWVEQGTLPTSFGLWWVHGLVLFFIFIQYLMQTNAWKRFT